MDCKSICSVNIIENSNLDPSLCYEFVRSPKCGAVNLFVGSIRDTDIRSDANSASQISYVPIKSIYYEAYEPMAKAQVARIVRETIGQMSCGESDQDANQLSRGSVHIRLGDVPVGEASIVIAVSSKGRQVSHAATMTILNRIKSSVAIWKRIKYCDGSEQWDHQDKSEASWLNQQV